jgi:cell division protein ZapA (FtsZ GTPase activity inhibitor)
VSYPEPSSPWIERATASSDRFRAPLASWVVDPHDQRDELLGKIEMAERRLRDLDDSTAAAEAVRILIAGAIVDAHDLIELERAIARDEEDRISRDADRRVQEILFVGRLHRELLGEAREKAGPR